MKIAIIPARAGSKRVKNKNVMDFCGKPMIGYALSAASQSGVFDKIHVSTDSEQIKQIVEDLGYQVDFLRPSHLADDITGLMPVLQWVLQQYAETALRIEDVCCLMPTAPLIEAEDIIRGYETYLKHDRQYPLHMVASFPVPIEWAYRRDNQGLLTPVDPGKFASRSQDLERAYYESGPFSFFHTSHILTDTPASDTGFISCILPPEKSVDIDEEEDIQLARILYLGRYIEQRPELMKYLNKI
jgi:pseudaminic acid cytidylyltransferase